MDIRQINRKVIEQFRAGGPVDGMHRDRLLLLTTTGRKSGQPRTTPMMFDRDGDGDDLVVIASNMGAPAHPDWYLNLLAKPEVDVQIKGETFPARARVADADEKPAMWDHMLEVWPDYAEYQANTDREIPIVVLERIA